MYHEYKSVSQIPLALYYLPFSSQCSAHNCLSHTCWTTLSIREQVRGVDRILVQAEQPESKAHWKAPRSQTSRAAHSGFNRLWKGQLSDGARQKKKGNRPQNPILLRENSFITKPNCTWKHTRMKSPFCIKLNSSLGRVNYTWECGSLPIVWRNFKVSRIVRQNAWLSTNDIC